MILYEETLYEKTEDGKTQLIDYLTKRGIVLGIKVDLVCVWGFALLGFLRQLLMFCCDVFCVVL